MSTTLTGTYTSTYYLTAPITQNPLTISTTGLFVVNGTPTQNLIQGNNGFPWTITNAGVITGTIINGLGISLSADYGIGSIENTGTIDVAGIYSGAIGTNGSFIIENSQGGFVSAANYGISAFGSYDRISNFGTIVTSQNDGSGMFSGGMSSSSLGVIVNGAAGGVDDALIKSGNYGIELYYGNNIVTNTGTVIGAIGIYTDRYTSYLFHDHAQISSPDTIINAGTIIGTGGIALSLSPSVTTAWL